MLVCWYGDNDDVNMRGSQILLHKDCYVCVCVAGS